MTATSRSALLIVNEKSRRGGESAQAAESLLAEAGLGITRPVCPRAEDVDAAIRQHGPDVDCIVLGGGDGTLNAAANALLAVGKPLGILPLGTGNDLARTLRIPLDLSGAVEVILRGKTARIDLGEVNGRPFFNVASFGLSTQLTRNLTSDAKRRWGRLGYAIALVRALASARPFSAVIRANGRVERVRTLQIAVGNGRHYGAGMTVEEDARIDDGILDLYSLEFDKPWRLLLIYPAFRKGKHRIWKSVRTLKTDLVHIETRRPRSINADGEITAHTPATFKVLRGAVQVYVP